MNLNMFIAHLENLRDHHNITDIKIVVPIDKGEDDKVIFYTVSSLHDINVVDIETDNGLEKILYIDACGILEVTKK